MTDEGRSQSPHEPLCDSRRDTEWGPYLPCNCASGQIAAGRRQTVGMDSLCDAPGPGRQHCNMPTGHKLTEHMDGRGGAPGWFADRLVGHGWPHRCDREKCPHDGWQPPADATGECPRCEGHGWINGGGVSASEARCDACQGTGRATDHAS